MPGIATDKLPLERYAQPAYDPGSQACWATPQRRPDRGPCARIGPTSGVRRWGRSVAGGEDGLPMEVMVADHTGAFGLLAAPGDLCRLLCPASQSPRQIVPDPKGFATAYLEAFRDQFLHIQGDYRKRRRAFDTLFKHCPYDPAGSFAYRWECVLRRLDQTNPYNLLEAIRQQIWVLNRDSENRRPLSPYTHPHGDQASSRALLGCDDIALNRPVGRARANVIHANLFRRNLDA